MIKTAVSLKDAGSKSLYTATIDGEWKSPYIYTNEAQKKKLLGDFKAGRSFEPTPAAEASATAGAAKKAEAPPAAKEPGEIQVTIRNGAGISGLAKQASLILKAKGFAVGETGNANQNVYKQTLVVYKTDRASAELVASALMPGHQGRRGSRDVLVPDRDHGRRRQGLGHQQDSCRPGLDQLAVCRGMIPATSPRRRR